MGGFLSVPILLIAAVLPSLHAQAVTSTTANDILSQMRSFRGQWMTNVWTYARNLFWLLAFIEFAWSVIALALDKTDRQCWMAGLVRKLMWIGAFYALLQNGSTWIPAIIDSFELIGSSAAGMSGPLDPGSVFVQGLTIAGSLLVRTAVAGGDPNWGRIIAAAGRSGVEIEPNRMSVSANGVPLFADGAPVDTPLAEQERAFQADTVLLNIELNQGAAWDEFFTCDMTEGYVRVNSHYRT